MGYILSLQGGKNSGLNIMEETGSTSLVTKVVWLGCILLVSLKIRGVSHAAKYFQDEFLWIEGCWSSPSPQRGSCL